MTSPPLQNNTSGKSVSRLIMRYLPDFCYQFPIEIVEMLEQIDEDISETSVEVTLTQLAKKGLVEVKYKCPTHTIKSRNRFCRMYRRTERAVGA
jgi:predicted transcriptional regulator